MKWYIMYERRNSFNDKRRIVDRRKNRFGRRGPTLILKICNFLTRDPRVFYAYIIFSSLFALIGLFFMSYNIPLLINKAFQLN